MGLKAQGGRRTWPQPWWWRWGVICPPAERKAILTGTKCISVKAARRRSRALAPPPERTSLSLHSLSEADDSQLPQPLACKRPPSPMLQHAVSEDNLSSSTGEAPPRSARQGSDDPGPWLPAPKKSLGKKRDLSLEAKRKKRKSQLFEVTGQGVSRMWEFGPLGCR